jgi:polygalacturonase
VFFPAGTYLTVSIRLQSHVTLHLGPRAVIEAALHSVKNYDEPEPGNDEAQKFSSFGHSHCRNSLISGIDLEAIAIVGAGRINGYGLFRDNIVPAGAANKAITLKNCRSVLLRDFTVLQGGHFAILASGLDNLTIDNVMIDTNRDGMDIDCCRDVRIANCRINSPFDDAICLKSSFGLGYVRVTENVTITNCQVSGYNMGTVLDGSRRRNVDSNQPTPVGVTGRIKFGPLPETAARHSGPTDRIKLGTESNGGFRNIAISNCTFDYCRRRGARGCGRLQSPDARHHQCPAVHPTGQSRPRAGSAAGGCPPPRQDQQYHRLQFGSALRVHHQQQPRRLH